MAAADGLERINYRAHDHRHELLQSLARQRRRQCFAHYITHQHTLHNETQDERCTDWLEKSREPLRGAAGRPARRLPESALTLRGPSGGHCVELKGGGAPRTGEARDTLGAPPGSRSVTSSGFFHLKAPRSGPRRVPGGSVQKRSRR